MPKNKDGFIHSKVTEKYFNPLRDWLAALDSVLQYDSDRGGKLSETTSSETLAAEVMTAALQEKHLESELKELLKEYFNPMDGSRLKEITHEILQKELQTCVTYILSKRGETSTDKTGSKRSRQGNSNQGKKKKQKTSNDEAGDDADVKALSASTYQKLEGKDKKKARQDALKKGGFCFQQAMGNCRYGDKCKFKHDGIPSRLQLKKRGGGGSGGGADSDKTSGGSPASAKQIAKMAAALVKKQKKAASKKKKNKRAKALSLKRNFNKKFKKHLKAKNFSKEERQQVMAYSAFTLEDSENSEDDSSSSDE